MLAILFVFVVVVLMSYSCYESLALGERRGWGALSVRWTVGTIVPPSAGWTLMPRKGGSLCGSEEGPTLHSDAGLLLLFLLRREPTDSLPRLSMLHFLPCRWQVP